MKFNLEKYMGTWHQIASTNPWFQRNCKQVKATYSLQADHVKVINSCINKDTGKKKKIEGKAFTTKKMNVLKVQFYWPFKSDYIIEYVDAKYQTAIVGTNDGTFWILSRNKRMSKQRFNQLLNLAGKKGYDVQKAVIEPHRVGK